MALGELRRWRWVVGLAAVLFAASTAMLLIASTLPAEIPGGTVTPLGVIDVALALAVCAILYVDHDQWLWCGTLVIGKDEKGEA